MVLAATAIKLDWSGLHHPKTLAVILLSRLWHLNLLFVLALVTSAFAENENQKYALGDLGYLVVTAAQDTAYGYHWVDGPGNSRRALVWAHGVLSIPFDFPVEGFGAFDLAIPCGDDFGGVGDAGRLLMKDGQYRINEPILLTDGTVYFFADDGLLEIVATRIRYFPPENKEVHDSRASFLLLAGLTILITVLIRRSRSIIKKRANSS